MRLRSSRLTPEGLIENIESSIAEILIGLLCCPFLPYIIGQSKAHLFLPLLELPHVSIRAVCCQQFVMSAAFCDPAMVHNQNLVGINDGG